MMKKMIILFFILTVSSVWTEVGADDFRAVSLKVLQDRLKSENEKGYVSDELLRFAGITRVDGYIVDKANEDLILFGKMETGFRRLYLDDFVIALRNTFLKYAVRKGDSLYYRAPYCSIEPDLQVTERLKNIGNQILKGSDSESVEGAVEEWKQLCRSSQSVRIAGIPFHSHFASVMVKADYDMKRLALGCDSANISEFKSLSDMTLEKARKDYIAKGTLSVGSSIGNRFWFYPGEIQFSEHEGIVALDECRIDLLTEESYLGKSGKISGEGKTSKLAENFAEDFTELYNDLAGQRPIYVEFENLFNILALSKGIKFKSSEKEAQIDLGVILEGYPVTRLPVSEYLPGESSVKQFEHAIQKRESRQIAKVWIPFCGGVAMNIKLSSRHFKWDTTGKLSQLRIKILEARPGPDTLSWNYHHWE